MSAALEQWRGTNLAEWVTTATIYKFSNGQFALRVGTHGCTDALQGIWRTLAEAKRAFSENFGRTDGKRTRWAKQK